MEGQHLGALVHERERGVAFARGVEPLTEPDHAHRGLGVDRTHAQREGVDALHHLGDRKTRHIAGLRGHASRSNAGEVTAFVVTRVGRGHVGRCLVTGHRLELHARELARHFECGLHVAEAGGEDDLMALHRQIADHPFGVRSFGHVFHIGGGHLAGQRRLHGLAALVVLAHPAGLGERCHVDESGLERCARRGGRLGLGGEWKRKEKAGDRQGAGAPGHEVFVHGVPRHGFRLDKKSEPGKHRLAGVSILPPGVQSAAAWLNAARQSARRSALMKLASKLLPASAITSSRLNASACVVCSKLAFM